MKPEMSAYEITDTLLAELDKQKHDFICLNFANGDMVGHTGVYEAVQKAIQTIDECSYKVVEAAIKNDYEVLIIADHGNADNAVNNDGSPNTAHSLNPVPIVYVSSRQGAAVTHGILADVAPSICQILDIPKPAEMTGKGLLTIND